MFTYKKVKDQIIEERRKNAELQAALDKTAADLDYVAMITEVELEEEEKTNEYE